ncbi:MULTISPECIES: metallophosphoesterase family protein [Sphingomonadales]|uniref:Serine/threonine protein phosphatase 1 n=1 Tax=Sphingopyxis terrae subsp. ummariensis TaxID=429001 RepID=A0A1Y6FW15_9SPHN|nr:MULTISPECIES: metallophosphoesterase family protein [Sphingomonadaceae]PCF90077.1 serine/threonine protein phosphatase [Sphingopyxis terrae subsp. ummariensis]SMQ79472.1 serine/threonine protein phosphatase 1 [Sphingopyxis terrae subsp. ummariensis]
MLVKILSCFGRRPSTVAHVPDGRRFYAIGDIHGHLDLLDGLLTRIRDDELERGQPKGELIFLGDLINRGPRSAQVIDRLIKLKADRPETRFLLGNHEELFLTALSGNREAIRFFDRIGGAETILSYGITRQAYEAANYLELAAMLQSAVPLSHKRFLESFEDMIVEGDYVFVHAGVRPGVPLEKQRAGDLRWIREEFLRESEKHASPAIPGMVVVHGHTIFENIAEHHGRIGLDTGAYRSGILSAMAFEGDKRWIIQEIAEQRGSKRRSEDEATQVRQ